VSEPKEKASADASESGTHKPKRKKEKLIRLDDLLPQGSVTGGRQLPFGASEIQPTQHDKE
jgi:hypothetical protein